MKSILTRILAGALMFLVALLCAFTTMRLAIHGREVDVPNLANLSDEDAAKAARKLGLNLSVENRFYSAAVAPNHVLSQSPAPGSLVRRGWQVRVTESLGGQKVSIPDVSGQTERPATLILRRLNLDIGTTAHLPAPGPEGIVLAQSPPANTSDLVGPRVSVLVSDPETSAPAQAYVMPAITGMTVYAATQKLATAGLRITSASDPTYVAPEIVPDPNADPAIPVSVPTPPPVSGTALINYQSPPAGHRVTRTDAIRVSASHPAAAPDPVTALTPQ